MEFTYHDEFLTVLLKEAEETINKWFISSEWPRNSMQRAYPAPLSIWGSL